MGRKGGPPDVGPLLRGEVVKQLLAEGLSVEEADREADRLLDLASALVGPLLVERERQS